MFVMHTAERVIATLRAHVAELRQAGLHSPSLFGSVARGETETTVTLILLRNLIRTPGWTSTS
jgi:predicted nucleotidyltransferase